jgi:hypothetical protein
MAKHPRFFIDKITNSIEEVATGTSYNTDIVIVPTDEIKTVHKKDGWFFNWKKEFKIEGRQIYKLVINGQQEIQGLISLEPISGVGHNFVEMHLIENAPHNYGEGKVYAGVAGNLVAFACKMSFDLGFDGFVAFVSKSNLTDHYIQTLGAQVIYGHNRMAIFPESAKNLVNSYYNNYIP